MQKLLLEYNFRSDNVKFRLFNKINSHLQYFSTNESYGGIVLLACSAIAIIIANSPLGSSYDHLLHNYLSLGFKDFSLSMSLLHWINDGLMTIFFFVVGMEIKRELVVGELKSISNAILPIAAAIGGMIVPALVYIIFNHNAPTVSGWGIPMATDIAFALGILSLVGSNRAPTGIVVFLTALAIVDDLGAILVIAIFYTSNLSLTALFFAVCLTIVLIIMNKLEVERVWPFILIGILLWFAILKSGIHATFAGVILAMTIPTNAEEDLFESSMLYTLEHALTPWSSFIIMPIFALANAGVKIELSKLSTALSSSVGLGILLGLFVGKQLGIFFSTYILTKLNLAELPTNVTFKHVYGASLLGGIGFTMSLFVSSLSFGENELLSIAKISILFASVLSSLVGILMFKSIKVTD